MLKWYPMKHMLQVSFYSRFCEDIEFMTGRRPHKIWIVLWVAVSPIVIASLLIGMVVQSAKGTLMYEIWDRVQVRIVLYSDVMLKFKCVVALWPNPAISWCLKLSEVEVWAPTAVASQTGTRSRLVNLLLRS